MYSTKCNKNVLNVDHLFKIIKQQYCIEKERVKIFDKNEEVCVTCRFETFGRFKMAKLNCWPF